MPANIFEKMFYSYLKPAWHAIREPSQVKKSAVRGIDEDFQGAFEVENRPVTVTLNGVPSETGDFAVVRCASKADPEEIVFDYCSERYHPLQPREVAEIFDNHVCEHAETVAFLGKGEEMFISWEMPSFEVRVGDEVQMYGIVRTGFDTKHATKLFTSTVRPVCWNTITMAEGWAKAHTDKAAAKGMIWTGKGVNRNLGRDLGYWMEHVQTKALVEAELIQSFFARLASKSIESEKVALEILQTAYPNSKKSASNYPWQLRDEQESKILAYNAGQEEIRNGIYGLFSGAGTVITPDYWGMLNSTSEYFCHYQPSKKPVAESIMFGARSKNIMAMVETLNKLSSK
jgi:hypothetical protein